MLTRLVIYTAHLRGPLVRIKLAVILICSWATYAQVGGASQKAPSKEAFSAESQPEPTITVEMREAFQHARADVAEAQSAMVIAQQEMTEAVKVMQAVCPLTLDQQHNPKCVSVPANPKEGSKK